MTRHIEPYWVARSSASRYNSAQNSGETVAGHVQNLTPWPKGVSGNPGGRPHKTALTDAIRDQLAQVAEKDKAGRTNAEVIAAVLIAKAKRGDVRAASEIADRAEGRPSQSLNLQGRMEVSTVEERRARLEVLIRKLSAWEEGERPAG
jgi:uncharacterized protein DUF5681